MAKKLSHRERWASRTGKSKSEFKESSEGQATKKIKKYYEEKKEFVKKKAKTDTTRLREDMETILREAGIAKTRAEEDYFRNIENLAEDKAADIDDLNFYVKTQTGRTEEDLDTALQKEARRYTLEQERLSESVGSRNLVYGNLGGGGVRAKEEGDILAETQEVQSGFQTEAKRSFQDIARYEYVKNRQVETEYGRATEEAGTKKTRGIEDVNSGVTKAQTATNRGVEDVSFAKKQDYWNLENQRGTDLSSLELTFAQADQAKKQNKEMWNVLGA